MKGFLGIWACSEELNSYSTYRLADKAHRRVSIEGCACPGYYAIELAIIALMSAGIKASTALAPRSGERLICERHDQSLERASPMFTAR